jgi:hypothetical protein
VDAWPIERTKRSRLGQTGALRVEAQELLPQATSQRRHRHGGPGWPELAPWTASMASVRIVLMLVNSIGERTGTSRFTIPALIRKPLVTLLIGPSPPRNIRGVDAMFVCVPAAGDLPVAEFLLGMRANALKFGNAVDGVNRKTEAVGFVVDRQFHRCIDVPFLLVAAHVQVLVVGAPVGQAGE